MSGQKPAPVKEEREGRCPECGGAGTHNTSTDPTRDYLYPCRRCSGSGRATPSPAPERGPEGEALIYPDSDGDLSELAQLALKGHPVQYESGGERFNRCLGCEEWSPCSHREKVLAAIEGADHAE